MRIRLLAALLMAFTLTTRARADDDPKAIIAKAIKALGGEESLTKFKGARTKAKGKIELLGGLEFTQETASMYPDKGKEIVEMEVMGQQVRVITLINGDKISMQANGQEVPVNDNIKAAIKGVGHMAKVGRLVPLIKEKGFELSLLGEIKVNGKPAVGVRVAAKDEKDINIYFDKQTGLPAKVERRAVDPASGNEVSEERIILEYGKTDGVPTPKKVLINHDNNKYMEVEILETKRLEKIDDSEFDKP